MRAACIAYLHGFRSTPRSAKARLLAEALAARAPDVCWVCPQLPASPRQAVEVAEAAIAGWLAPAAVPRERLVLVGSSLGGYYATHLAERIGCRAVLLNPAIRPADDLRAHLGRQTVFNSTDTIDMRPEYLDELLAIDTPAPTRRDRYLLVAATGDEVIDWRTMVAKYAGCRQRVVQGSDHSLTDFAAHLDAVLDFCGLSPTHPDPPCV